MNNRLSIRPMIALSPACLWILGVCLAISVAVEVRAQAPQTVVLDRVVAVVNNQAILASDIDQEIQLSVLDPGGVGLGALTRQRALEQLISRALIQQQIHEEDVQAADPPQSEIAARLMEIRKELPVCIRQNCSSDAGWKAFLAAHGLTEERVESYLRYRLQIRRFIEQRFQPGIHVSPEQIESYYRGTLLPQYTAGETIPKLEQVAPRIEEILLQQQVNVLFDDWLSNLRKQGEVEVLDPALESPDLQTGAQSDSPHQETAPASAPAKGSKSSNGKGSQ
jgi:peptidyl-prolyl cis-trans isomerase SurA